MPIEPRAKIRISEIGRFATDPRMKCPSTVQPLPHGSTLNASSAVNIDTTGAMM